MAYRPFFFLHKVPEINVNTDGMGTLYKYLAQLAQRIEVSVLSYLE